MTSQTFQLFTSEVFAHHYLKTVPNFTLVEWAENMVIAGFDSEHLDILLGEIAPFNGFEMDDLLTRIQNDLGLPKITSHSEAVAIAATAYVKRFLQGVADSGTTMFTVAKLYTHDEQSEVVCDFYFLHLAAVDLAETDYQYYWPNASRHNIENVIKTRCVEWVKQHPLDEWQKYEWTQKR